jgi:hypothetical protein
MKNIFGKKMAAVVLLLFCAVSTNAQYYNLRNAVIAQHGKFASQCIHIATILERKNASNSTVPQKKAARTTDELAERLLASSLYNITDTTAPIGFVDSAWYKYSATRSSIFNYDHMNFDDYYYMGSSFIIGFGGDLGSHDHNNTPSILFDTALYIGTYFSPIYMVDTFGIYDTRYAFYDSSYNVTEYADLYLMDSTSAHDNSRFINTYDTSGNIIHSLALSWDYGIWDSSQYRSFFYDTANRVVLDSTSVNYGGSTWAPDEKYYYTFDDSGNMIHANAYFDSAGTWIPSVQYFMHYNSANQLRWDSVCQYTGGVWIPQASDTISYALGYRTYEKTLNAVGGTPASYLIFTKHINGSGLPDTMYQEEYNYSDNTIIEKMKYSYSYDSYDEPTIAINYKFNVDTTFTSGWYDTTADYITYYYYETYARHAHNNAVNNVTETTENIKVYPNPTTNEINIYRPGAAQGTYTFIKLINTAGQTVRTESFPWHNETETVSMAGLAPGVYWVAIQDKSGNVVWRAEVVKE